MRNFLKIAVFLFAAYLGNNLILGFFAYLLVGFVFSELDVMVEEVAPKEAVQESFFRTVFLTVGYIAKYDGRVSQQDISVARRIMEHMRLAEEQRLRAMKLFTLGKQDNFNLEVTLAEFSKVCGSSGTLMYMFLDFLLLAAHAEGSIRPETEKVLRSICVKIGMSSRVLDKLQRRFYAEQRFYSKNDTNAGQSGNNYHSRYSGRKYSNQADDDAYAILGVKRESSFTAVKSAYRKLMSQNHPDKLMAKGVPEEMIKLATERVQKIQEAFDSICKERGKR